MAQAKPFKGKTRENPVKPENSIKIKKKKWENKQKHRQVVETNKSHLQMLTYISKAQLSEKKRQVIETNAHLYCMPTKADNKCPHT